MTKRRMCAVLGVMTVTAMITLAADPWRLNYSTCAYVFVPRVFEGRDVDYVRVESGVLARKGRQGTLDNAFSHSQALDLLDEVDGGFAAYVTLSAVQDSTSNEFDVGVYTREIIVFADGERTTMPRRVYYFARPDNAIITCGPPPLTNVPAATRSVAAQALIEAVNTHKAGDARREDVLFVTRWGEGQR